VVRDADEVLRIARDCLAVADMKLVDAADWLVMPDGVAMTAEQRAEVAVLRSHVEVARAAISAARS
jgi:hypothetical protein